MNRLSDATSPYLLQHAGNPVDWWPWSEEAFAEARARDVPVLLSVGYAACHWCHVMAHESFEDPAVAAAMNRDFINVKVDREERPDLDQIYQTAHALLTRRATMRGSAGKGPVMRRAVLLLAFPTHIIAGRWNSLRPRVALSVRTWAS